MVNFAQRFLGPTLWLAPCSSSRSHSLGRTRLRNFPCAVSSTSSSSPMDRQNRRQGFMEYPHLSAPHRDLMIELVSTMETRLGSQLLPDPLPPDVQCYQNAAGTSQGALHIRPGDDTSSIEFILGSWIYCELPSGGALNITTLMAYLNKSTDAPNFVLEFVQMSPTSLVLILDLPPRRDLPLYPDYLDTFYVDTKLDGCRQALQKLPEVQPYFSPVLYVRCVWSPTATVVHIQCEQGQESGQARMEEIVRDHVSPIAKQVLRIWLDKCACGEGREVKESERSELEKRDRVIRTKTIEIDLVSNLPRLFGPDVGSRIVNAIQEFLNK